MNAWYDSKGSDKAIIVNSINVFIRLFVSVEDTNARKSKQITEELAKKIEDKIDSFSINK